MGDGTPLLGVRSSTTSVDEGNRGGFSAVTQSGITLGLIEGNRSRLVTIFLKTRQARLVIERNGYESMNRRTKVAAQ